MHMDILKHDGPGRLGKFVFEDLEIPTPSILWSRQGGKPPVDHLELIPYGHAAGEATILDYGSIFSKKEIKKFGILPSFPAGYHIPLEIAKKAVEETLDYAGEHPGFGGVIEGGRYLELLKKSAELLKDRPMVEIANSTRLIKNHRALVNVITSIRESVSPNTAIYMAGIPPTNFPALVYMGVDFFDLKMAILGAHEQIYLMHNGLYDLKRLRELPCPCGVCEKTPPGDLNFKGLLSHNVLVTQAVIREVREAMRDGRLRNMVEERAICDVSMMGALKILDTEKQDYLEKYTPIYQKRTLMI